MTAHLCSFLGMRANAWPARSTSGRVLGASSWIALLLTATLVASDAFAQGTAAVTGATVLRQSPAVDAPTVELLPAGTTVTTVRHEGSWWLVTAASGRQGYVHDQFLRTSGGTTPAAAPPPPPTARGARPAPAPLPPPAPARRASGSGSGGIRLFVDGGLFAPAAKQSFSAVFGSNNVPAFGGGLSASFGSFFAQASYRRSTKTGERVIVLDDEVFPLGVEDKLVLAPLSFTGGIRLPLGAVVPYVGGGVTLLSVKETSAFAAEGDDVDERFTGAHAIAGADVFVMRWLALGGEVEYSRIKSALDTGTLAEFGEDNLGGWAFRGRIAFVFGR